MRITWIVWLLLAFVSFDAASHGGGLDSSGGHYDRKTGNYHCHRAPCGTKNTSPTISSNASAPSNPPKTTAHLSNSAVPIYDRKDWVHWIDTDGNCVNTRHEVLIAQAVGPIKKSPDGCFVSMGAWQDPYSGKKFNRASELDIDHVIPLKWAHDHGGSHWSLMVKEAFANELDNLLAVSKSVNREKRALGPDQWLPLNHAYRCDYLKRWRKILIKYPELRMKATEQRVLERQLNSCN